MIGKNRSDTAGLLEPWEVGILSPSTQTPPAQAEKRCAAGAQSVERALYLLQMIGEEDGPVSLPVLCERTGLNRTTVWRLLSTLEKYHFLCRNPKTKDYDLGYGATMLCTAPQRRYATLIRRAQPAMERLVEHTQESLVLSVPHAGGTLVVYQMDSPLSIRLKDYTNQITPLWNTSNGKVLLADLPPPGVGASAPSAAHELFVAACGGSGSRAGSGPAHRPTGLRHRGGRMEHGRKRHLRAHLRR